MIKVIIISLGMFFSSIVNGFSQNPNSELIKKFEATSIHKNKLNIALQIIDNYIEQDKDDSAQIWFNQIAPIRNIKQISEQDYFFQSLQTELYYFSDLLNLAEQASNDALSLAKKLNNPYYIADAYFYKGLIKHSNGSSKEALENFQLASRSNPHRFSKELANYVVMPAQIYNNIAQAYNSQQQWDSSYKYNMLALNELKKNHIDRSEALIYNDLATTYYCTQKFDSAIYCYQYAFEICEKEKIKDIPLLLYIGLANTNLLINKKEESLKYLKLGIRHLSNNVNNYYVRIFYQNAIPIYHACNDMMGELAMYKNLQQLHVKNDSLYNKQLLTIYHYTTNNKNKLLEANLQATKLKQRNANFQLLFLSLLLISGGISFIFYRKRQRVKNKLKVVKHDIGKDLHDEMGATISSIKMYSGLAQNEQVNDTQRKEFNSKISILASDLGEKLNTIIWSMDEKNDTVENLVEKLQHYSTNFFDASDIQFQFSQTNGIGNTTKIKGIARKNIFLVCKEAINNIVKHAFANKVWFYITCYHDTMQIQIIDNGNGIADENKFGNGLKNMQNRIAEINGSINWKVNNGTCVTINCNL